ncbi:hypothetical protein SAMN05216570_2616 [Dyella sp. OK004]|uniref:hypothetical protein n=1 Tax=Dyella sp. OK004 TaxID=1855292 RepID=UPI0008EDEA21|nr:hypothetical protein [Dyella sp. OK004]SFS12124.1 hypothetical protein SAMN05216570_2616 [Dyella sp. OK004]
MSDNTRSNAGLRFLLSLSVLGLWASILVTALIFMGRGGGDYGTAMAMGLLLLACLAVAGAALLLFGLYTVFARPWRLAAGAERKLFVVHAWLASVVLLVGGGSVARSYLEDLKSERSLRQGAHQNQIVDAITKDDTQDFERELKACGDLCADDTWVEEAVDRRALRVLAWQLSSLDKAQYQHLYTERSNKHGCQGGSLFDIAMPVSGLAGLRYQPEMISALQPFWTVDDLHAALWGAAAGDHPEGMQALIKAGADPSKPLSSAKEGSLILVATGRGAEHSLAWLATQGYHVDAASQHDLWMALIHWGNQTAAETYRGRMDSVLDSLIAMGASITPASPEGDPLRLALQESDSILAKALVRRGASDTSWSPDERKTLAELVAQSEEEEGMSQDSFHLRCNPFGLREVEEAGTDRE